MRSTISIPRSNKTLLLASYETWEDSQRMTELPLKSGEKNTINRIQWRNSMENEDETEEILLIFSQWVSTLEFRAQHRRRSFRCQNPTMIRSPSHWVYLGHAQKEHRQSTLDCVKYDKKQGWVFVSEKLIQNGSWEKTWGRMSAHSQKKPIWRRDQKL